MTKKELLVVCGNISAIIKDLFRIPPQHTAVVTLSWKTPTAAPVTEKPKVAPGQKRNFTPISGPTKDKEEYSSNGVTPKMSRPYNRKSKNQVSTGSLCSNFAFFNVYEGLIVEMPFTIVELSSN